MKRRPPLSRRTFIKLTATVAAGAALASCSPKQSPLTPTQAATSGTKPTIPPSPTEWDDSNWERSQRASFDPGQPHGDVYQPWNFSNHESGLPGGGARTRPGSHHTRCHRGPGWHGGFRQRGVRRDHQAQHLHRLPPPEYATTTNPTVVATLVTMCLEAGAKRVRVMDYPFGGTATSAYATSGIGDAVEAAGGEMQVMSPSKYTWADIPEGRDITKVQIYPDILEADLLINVPIAKDHGSTRLTLGGKNLMGVILDRGMMHMNLGQRIADLTSLVRPPLTVIDAVRILTANGPTGGDLADVKQLDTVIASRDIVAADAYATTLFGLTGNDIGYITASADMGLGTMDLSSINIQEISLG